MILKLHVTIFSYKLSRTNLFHSSMMSHFTSVSPSVSVCLDVGLVSAMVPRYGAVPRNMSYIRIDSHVGVASSSRRHLISLCIPSSSGVITSTMYNIRFPRAQLNELSNITSSATGNGDDVCSKIERITHRHKLSVSPSTLMG